MGIVLGKVSDAKAIAQNLTTEVKPPVPGAVRLTPLEMNMLHFGSDKHSPLPDKTPAS